MDRTPSDHLDDLLLSLSRMEYRDFVGVNPDLAKALIKLFNRMNAMLDLELKQRTLNAFMPPGKHQVDGSGAWPGG